MSDSFKGLITRDHTRSSSARLERARMGTLQDGNYLKTRTDF
jgi:hypothetical protein